MTVLPFDAHNHVHMGPSPPLHALYNIQHELTLSTTTNHNNANNNNIVNVAQLSGMSIMSTHPRDYQQVLDICNSNSKFHKYKVNGNRSGGGVGDNGVNNKNNIHILGNKVHLVPNLGVHPWFLHELDESSWLIPNNNNNNKNGKDGNDDDDDDDEEEKIGDDFDYFGDQYNNDDNNNNNPVVRVPNWICELESMLLDNPHAMVGEIGLDKFHFDPETKELVSSMEDQIHAFELQLQLATKLERPVSIHCVQAMGPMMDTIRSVYETNRKRHKREKDKPKRFKKKQKQPLKDPLYLPPKMYFHAFAGKAASVEQLIALCETKRLDIKDENKKTIYFGFSPAIKNFQSPKTCSVIQTVGLDRLVLETDHEDADCVLPSMLYATSYIANDVFGISEQDLITQTTLNAFELYGLS